jgi:hypothetical protein
MMTQTRSVEQRLREALGACGQNMSEVARAIGVTPQALHYFRVRGLTLKLPTAERLMAYLGFRVVGPGED